MKARKQKGGIPAGSAALAAVAKEKASKGKAVDRLADWLGSAVLVTKGFRRRRPVPKRFFEEVAALVADENHHTSSRLKAQAREFGIILPDLMEAIRDKNVERCRLILEGPSSFLEEVAALVAEEMPHTPSSLKAQAEKHGISLPYLAAAIRDKDVERLRLILARPNARADAAMEEAFEADDGTGEWQAILTLWKSENPCKTPKPGEVVRWQAARQKVADEARAAASVNLKARAKAAGDRDITPPALEGDELAAALESFRKIPWEDREQWPTKDDVRVSTGMSGRELGRILKGGRWEKRNVWKGSGCKSSRGGQPPHKISPVGMRLIVRAFLKKGKLPVDRAREFLEFLGSVEF
jgi:hypothetical protein